MRYRSTELLSPTGVCSVIAMLSFLAVGCTSANLSSTGPSTTKCQVSATGAGGVIAATGGTMTVSVAAEPECAWKASADAAWITDVTPDTGQGSAAVAVRVMPNGDPVQRRGSVQIASATVSITQDPAPCAFSVAPLKRDVGAGSGTATVAVTGNPACGWTATSTVPWLTVTAGASGSGNGAVTIAFAANLGAARSGSVTVAGQTVTVNQADDTCLYSLSSTSQTIAASGGSGATMVVAIPNSCTWTAVSNTHWVTVRSGASGSGSGNVTFTVDPNAGVERTGTLTIAGETYTVTQSAVPVSGPSLPTPAPTGSCTFTIAPVSASLGSAGGVAPAVAVTTDPSCAWTASSKSSWITIIGGGSGTGNGSVSYSVASNTGAGRTDTITIAGHTFTVNQAGGGGACSVSLNRTSQSVSAAGGGSNTVSVTATSGCSWTAASNETWITVNSGASGTGNGSVGYTVAGNTAAARTGTITIANQTLTVNQAAAPVCSFGINPSAQSFSAAGGGSNTVSVTATSGCSWTAVSNDTWITLNSGASGTGNGSVGFSVAANAGATRSGTMTIAGLTFTVTQSVICTYHINPTHQLFDLTGGTGTVAVSAPASCTWTAISDESWITVTSAASGSGNGTIAFRVDATPNNKDRNGTITIATERFTVNQKK